MPEQRPRQPRVRLELRPPMQAATAALSKPDRSLACFGSLSVQEPQLEFRSPMHWAQTGWSNPHFGQRRLASEAAQAVGSPPAHCAFETAATGFCPRYFA